MSLDKATVARIAALARIRVAEEDLDGLARELSNILGWIEQLNAVDTEGVPPMSRAADQKLRWREDQVTDGGIPEKVLANAPAAKDDTVREPTNVSAASISASAER